MRRTRLAIRRDIVAENDENGQKEGVGQVGDDAAETMPKRGAAELRAILEALIFASPEPLTLKALVKLLDNEPKEDIQAALAELKRDYERPGGLQLVEIAGGYQIVTRQDLHDWVRRPFHERTTQKPAVAGPQKPPRVSDCQPITAA